jgi:hypothetical protein
MLFVPRRTVHRQKRDLGAMMDVVTRQQYPS